MTARKYFFSIKKRKGYADKTKIVHEVYVRQPDYKNYPISVGGQLPYTFASEEEARQDCERRIADKIANGHDASYEIIK